MLVGVAGAYGLYQESPDKRQDGQAAAYERTVWADVAAVGDVRVVSGGHRVTAAGGNGDFCMLRVGLKVSTSMPVTAFEGRLPMALGVDTTSRVTELGDANGRNLLRIDAQTPGCG